MEISKQSETRNCRQLITSLITSIPPPSNAQNPLKESTSETKNLFLTLYAIFEKELLPALDCLDRNLVTRLKLVGEKNDDQSVFLVRSAQQHHTRHGTFENVSHYEVRLNAWSCSCPAFIFSAFPAGQTPVEGSNPWSGEPEVFGGLSRGSGVAVCKHILACVLVKHCEGFGGFVEEREVSKEELAGWAAGWGD